MANEKHILTRPGWRDLSKTEAETSLFQELHSCQKQNIMAVASINTMVVARIP